MTPLRIVFLGTPAFAVPTLDRLVASAHRVVGVITQPDRPIGRGQKVQDGAVKAAALRHGLPVLQPDTLRDTTVDDQLRAWAPDLGVVAAYGKIIPERLIHLPRLGMINVHASLLPRYRGASPIHRAVLNGDADTGVTIMRVVKALDAGAMFARVVRPIGPDETSETVEHELARIGADLLVDIVDAMAAGQAAEEPQDPTGVTYAPRLTKQDGLIDWTRLAEALRNQVRGLHPWPLASTTVGGRRLILLRSHVVPLMTPAAPGTVVAAHGSRLEFATGDGLALAIDEVQPEGRRRMEARDFLAGHPLSEGDRAESPAPSGGAGTP